MSIGLHELSALARAAGVSVEYTDTPKVIHEGITVDVVTREIVTLDDFKAWLRIEAPVKIWFMSSSDFTKIDPKPLEYVTGTRVRLAWINDATVKSSRAITFDEMSPAERRSAAAAYESIHRGEFDRSFAPNRAWAEGWVIANRGFLAERLASAMASNVLGQAATLLDEIGDMLEKACEKNPALLEEIAGFRFPMADECGGLASMCRDAGGALDGKKVADNG